MTESSKGFKITDVSNPVKTERNRLVSWQSRDEEFTKPVAVIAIPKNATTTKLLEFVSMVMKLIVATLVKLPYTVFKLGYEIAKLVTRGLSRIRRLLFAAK